MGVQPYYLITAVEKGTDGRGDPIVTVNERKIFPLVNSVKQSEFYQAQANGYKVEQAIEIRKFEYKGEEKVRHGDSIYEVVRTEDKGYGKIGLILKKGAV